MTTTPPPNPPDTPAIDARRDSLIDYPSRFPIKVMGAKAEGFPEAMTHIARQFDPAFGPADIEHRESSKGNYTGLTLIITATSREQLDEIYRTLSTHPMVKVVL